MGYVDFDGERLFDLRKQVLAELQPLPIDNTHRTINQDYCLQSDSRLRIDSAELKRDVEQAQKNKEELERLQRHDKALREAA